MTAVCLTTVCLVGIDDGVSGRHAGTRRQHPRWRSVSTRDHGELVRPGRGAVVQIWCAAGLEGPTLVLGGSGVRRRQIGVVVGGARHAEGHAGGDRCGCVGERCGIVHSGIGESALCERREGGKLTLELARVSRERAQI